MSETLTLFGNPAARGSSSSAPRPPAPRPAAVPGCARPGPEDEGRPWIMEMLAVPLNGLSDSLLAELDKLGPGWTWGRDGDWDWFVEGAGDGTPGSARRFTHPKSLRRAIAKALAARAAGGDLEDEPS